MSWFFILFYFGLVWFGGISLVKQLFFYIHEFIDQKFRSGVVGTLRSVGEAEPSGGNLREGGLSTCAPASGLGRLQGWAGSLSAVLDENLQWCRNHHSLVFTQRTAFMENNMTT